VLWGLLHVYTGIYANVPECRAGQACGKDRNGSWEGSTCALGTGIGGIHRRCPPAQGSPRSTLLPTGAGVSVIVYHGAPYPELRAVKGFTGSAAGSAGVGWSHMVQLR
jgi:hypothetical protein